MKQVVSVSLGSPLRDYEIAVEALGCRISIKRIGTGGDLNRAAGLLKSLDGKVNAIGLGGVNLFLRSGQKLYRLKDGEKLAANVRCSPLVDGSGIKDTIERDLVSFLQKRIGLPQWGQSVLVVSALDRFGMTEALKQAGCRLIIGDAVFALGLPVPFYSLALFRLTARAFLPVFSRLPINLLYPLGNRQETSKPSFPNFYRQADIIAGDFHFIRYRLPPQLKNKDVITSTLTPDDVRDLQNRGVRWLVTTGPSFHGRSLGANVIEAVCVALLEKSPGSFDPSLYRGLVKEMGWEPRVERLN